MSTDWSLYTRWEYARTRQTSQFGSAKVKKKNFRSSRIPMRWLGKHNIFAIGIGESKADNIKIRGSRSKYI